MSLYPTLEDLEIDKMVQVQRNMLKDMATQQQQCKSQNECSESNLYPTEKQQSPDSISNKSIASGEIYPALGNFLGLELSEEMIRENMPEYINQAVAPTSSGYPVLSQNTASVSNVVAPLTGSAPIATRAQVNHNIREIILCKDGTGKAGLRVQSIDNGIFVCILVKDSPAALAGLRFGDQILQINGTLVAGYSVDKVHKILKKADGARISLVVRDRPFERTVTLLKDSSGGFGFQFKNGEITAIVKDSSAARNGILTNHHILELNGQTVVALKDKEISKILNEADRIVKITIIPSFIYKHLVKKLGTSFLRGIMDHSVAEF